MSECVHPESKRGVVEWREEDGTLMAKRLCACGHTVYVAVKPADGKEVDALTREEMVRSLKGPTTNEGEYVECWLRRLPDGTLELSAHPTQYPLLMSWPEVVVSETISGDLVDGLLSRWRPRFISIVIDDTMPRPTYTGAL